MKNFMSRINWLVETNGNPQGFFDSLFKDFLGPALAFAGGAAFPEFAIPAEIAGGFLGGTAGGLIGGEKPGQALIQGAETGAISGITGAIGEAAGVTPSSVLGDLGIGTTADTAGAAVAPTVGTTAAPATASPAAAPTGSPVPLGGSASAAGIAGGGVPNDIFFGSITADAGPTAGNLNATELSQLTGPSLNTPIDAAAPSSFGGGPSTIPGTTNVTDAAGNLIGQDFSSGAAGGGSGVSDFITKHWPMLASAGILGFQGLTQNKNLPQENQLQSIANAQSSEAATLTNPINTGQLPPGAAQAVSSATAAQKAGISDTFSKLGLSGSTMEQQAKAGVDRQAAAQTFQIADQLLSKGIQLSQLSAQDLQFLIEEQLKGDQQFQSALSSFAGGLAGQKLTG